MKKQILTSMIAIALLTGCDDKPTDKATTEAAETAKQVAEVVKPDVSPAEQAEEMFKATIKAGEKYYQKLLMLHPAVESVKYELVSYEKGQDSALAVTKGTVKLKIEFEGKKSFDLSLNHNIKYDDAALDSGLVAKIDSTIIKPTELTEEQSKFFDELNKNFSYTTEIGKDQSINQNMTFKAFSFGDEAAVSFKGANINSKTTIKQIEGGFGKFVLDFKGIIDSNGFEVKPTSIEGEYKSNYDFATNLTAPLTISIPDGSINIESLSAKGNIKINDKFNIKISNSSYDIKNIQIVSNELPLPVTVQSARINFSNAISDKDIYTQKFAMQIIPAKGLVSKLSQGVIDASEANFHFDVDNIPAEIIKDYDSIMLDTMNISNDIDLSKYSDKMEAKLATMFDKVKQSGGQLDYGLDLATDQGKIMLDGNVKMKSESTMTLSDIMDSSSPDALLQTLNINIDTSVPAKLLEMVAGENIMMVGMFMTKEGDAYKSKITTEDGKLMINGVPAPF